MTLALRERSYNDNNYDNYVKRALVTKTPVIKTPFQKNQVLMKHDQNIMPLGNITIGTSYEDTTYIKTSSTQRHMVTNLVVGNARYY